MGCLLDCFDWESNYNIGTDAHLPGDVSPCVSTRIISLTNYNSSKIGTFLKKE